MALKVVYHCLQSRSDCFTSLSLWLTDGLANKPLLQQRCASLVHLVLPSPSSLHLTSAASPRPLQLSGGYDSSSIVSVRHASAFALFRLLHSCYLRGRLAPCCRWLSFQGVYLSWVASNLLLAASFSWWVLFYCSVYFVSRWSRCVNELAVCSTSSCLRQWVSGRAFWVALNA